MLMVRTPYSVAPYGLGLLGGEEEGAADRPLESLAAQEAGPGVQVVGVDEEELDADGGGGAVGVVGACGWPPRWPTT